MVVIGATPSMLPPLACVVSASWKVPWHVVDRNTITITITVTMTHPFSSKVPWHVVDHNTIVVLTMGPRAQLSPVQAHFVISDVIRRLQERRPVGCECVMG